MIEAPLPAAGWAPPEGARLRTARRVLVEIVLAPLRPPPRAAPPRSEVSRRLARLVEEARRLEGERALICAEVLTAASDFAGGPATPQGRQLRAEALGHVAQAARYHPAARAAGAAPDAEDARHREAVLAKLEAVLGVR